MSDFLVTSPSDRSPAVGVKTAALPLTVDGRSMLASIGLGVGGRARCWSVLPVSGGQFVHGSDNAVFGQWDALLAVMPSGKWTVVPGHAGEIIPGRLDDHVERLGAVARGEPRGPVQVDFDVSMACPSACSFCFSAPYRLTRQSGRILDGDLMLTLIRQWADGGVRVVRFDGGGDPLTHPRLPEALSLCAERGMRTAVLTSGDLLSESLLPRILAARTYLRVSLNAARDVTRWRMHGQRTRAFPVTSILSVVSALVRLREAEFGPGAGQVMPLGATSMIHPGNVAETTDIARLARDTGFDHISFRVILGNDHKVTFSEEQLVSLRAQFTEIRSSVAGPDFQVFLPTRDLTDTGYVPSEFFKACRASTHRAVVEVGSRPGRAAVVPCGRYRGEGYRSEVPDRPRVMFGELDGSTTVAEVHASPRSRRLLATFPDACGDCIDRSANTMLERIAELLHDAPGTEFHPLRTPGAAEGHAYA
ncbi:radical SAM protein [Streptomyces avermitilis]